MAQKHKQHKVMTYDDRKKIEGMKKEGASAKTMARVIGVCMETIYRELKRGNDNGTYSAEKAQRMLFAAKQ
jgi:IS30 family transposase